MSQPVTPPIEPTSHFPHSTNLTKSELMEKYWLEFLQCVNQQVLKRRTGEVVDDDDPAKRVMVDIYNGGYEYAFWWWLIIVKQELFDAN